MKGKRISKAVESVRPSKNNFLKRQPSRRPTDLLRKNSDRSELFYTESIIHSREIVEPRKIRNFLNFYAVEANDDHREYGMSRIILLSPTHAVPQNTSKSRAALRQQRRCVTYRDYRQGTWATPAPHNARTHHLRVRVCSLRAPAHKLK